MTIDLSAVADPAEAFKLFEQLQQDPDAIGAAPAAEAKTEPETKTEPAAEQKDDEGTKQEQEPEGIATRDGKHVIPYSVLKSERERAAQAERQLQETLERVKALEGQVAAAKPEGAKTGEDARTTTPATTETDVSAEDLAFLEEEFPTVAKAIKAALKRAESLEAKLQPVEQKVQGREEVERAQRAQTVQEAIDANPKLAHIQASDPELFAVAQQFDNVLRNQAAWADKPLAERFAKVIDMVEAANGAINVPGQTSEAKNDPAKLREAAAQAAAAQAKKAAVPTSLSQFPAGEPVASDEVEALAQMSHHDIAAKLARMSPEKQLEFLANL